MGQEMSGSANANGTGQVLPGFGTLCIATAVALAGGVRLIGRWAVATRPPESLGAA